MAQTVSQLLASDAGEQVPIKGARKAVFPFSFFKTYENGHLTNSISFLNFSLTSHKRHIHTQPFEVILGGAVTDTGELYK